MNTVETLLAANREAIVQRWQHLILDTYPPETAKLWKKSSDPYHNPVGARIREMAGAVVDYLAAGGDKAALEPVLDHLDELVRVRAVQNFSPSRAAGFLFLLKKVLREGFWQDFVEANAWDQLLAVETRIDGLALASLDLYAKCREKLHEIKYKDLERSQVQLLKRAQLIVGIGEGESAE